MKVHIVDEHDELVEYADVAEVQKGRIFRVSTLWAENFANEVLISKRSLAKKMYPGVWGPAAGGKIEEGEDYEEGMRREVREELGVDDLDLKHGPKIRISGKYNYYLQVYIANIEIDPSELSPCQEEVEDVKWMEFYSLYDDVKERPGNYIDQFKKVISIIEATKVHL